MRDDTDGAQTALPGERGSHSSRGVARAVKDDRLHLLT